MVKKLPLKYSLIILFFGLLFLEGQVFSQDPSDETLNEEVHETKDLEKLLKSYNKDREKVLDDTTKIHGLQNEETTEISENEIEEMPEIVREKKPIRRRERIEVKKDAKLSDSVRISLVPLQKLKEEELLKMLNENTKDSKFRPYIEQFPKMSLLAARLIKDPEAIPSLVKIVEDKDRLIRFAGFMISTFFVGFILKKILYSKEHSFFLAAGLFFFRFLFMQGLRLWITYFFFKIELTPAVHVFKKTFL